MEKLHRTEIFCPYHDRCTNTERKLFTDPYCTSSYIFNVFYSCIIDLSTKDAFKIPNNWFPYSFNTFWTSEKRTSSLQRTQQLSLYCSQSVLCSEVRLYYKPETADWVEDELWTSNCKLYTAISIQKKEKSCLCEARTHDLHVTARCSTDNTMSNSFYSVFIVRIIYSQQVSIFMKQPCSIHNRFCSAKRKKLSVWGSNSQPWRY